MKKIFSSVFVFFLLINSSFAQQNTGGGLVYLVKQFKDISTGVYSSLMVVALIAFFVGIIKMLSSQEAAGKAESYKFFGFGIVALFVMVSIWGLVAFMASNLGIDPNARMKMPPIPTSVETY